MQCSFCHRTCRYPSKQTGYKRLTKEPSESNQLAKSELSTVLQFWWDLTNI